ELTPGFVDADYASVDADRPWLGIWRCQVEDTNPDLDGIKNRLRLVLVEEVEALPETTYVLAVPDGRFFQIESGINRFLEVPT
nr:hypothetical protein [Elusimicrobiota bacterium]